MSTCLVVDDSKVVRMVARKMLESLKFDVEEAEDGQQAMNACQRNMPTSILLDCNMSIMNGFDFLTELHATKGIEQPIVVMCTTENDMAHVKEAMSKGADEYIMKPFDGDIIKSKFVQVGLL